MSLSTTYTKTETDYLIQQLEKKTASGYKGDLRKSDPAPTEIGYYILLDVGTYANLGGLNAVLNRFNFASFDGTTWSLLSFEVTASLNNYYTKSEIDNEISWTVGFFLSELGDESPASFMSTSDYIRVKANTYYTLHRDYEINYKSIAFYDENKQFIERIETQIFKIPEGVNFIRYSRENSETINPYLLPQDNIVVSQQSNVYDFKTIESAIDYADFLNDGVKTIKIVSKITLTQTLENYSNHVFEGSSSEDSVIEFISNNELLKTSVSTYRNLQFIRKGVLEGYCIHPDYAGEGVVEFDNCIIINTMGACFGSGSHENQTLRIKNSEVKSISNGNHLSPTLYWHNNVDSKQGQRLELLNSTFYSDYERPLQISDQNLNLGDGTNRDSEILAIGNRFYGALYGLSNMLIEQPSSIGTNTVAGNIKLNPMSGGNNIAKLNYV